MLSLSPRLYQARPPATDHHQLHRFVDCWGTLAVALGWSTLDVFGAHPTHPVERLDYAGVVLLLHGDELVALTADTARILTGSGTLLTYYRRPRSGAVPFWELR